MSRLPYRCELLLWLWLACFLNQADRQIFGVILPQRGDPRDITWKK